MTRGVEEPKTEDFEGQPDASGRGQSLKVRKIGNSLGVILPKELLNTLNVRDGDELEFSLVDGKAVELRNVEDEADKLMAAAERIMIENRTVLRALAK